MRTNPIKNTPNRKKFLLIIAGVLVIGALFAYMASANSWFRESVLNIHPETRDTSKDTIRETNDIDYSGPSKSDVESSQNGKKREEEQEQKQQTNKTSSVSVAVSFADKFNGNVEVRAFIPDIIEGDGTCTAILTQSGKTVQKSSKAFIDASSSQCTPIYIPVSDFPSQGIWNLIVSYESASSKGISEKIEVQL